MRAGDAAAAAARRGLRALRDPFLQEVREPAQLAELRGALRSGAPGSAGGAGFWRRRGCRGPLSAPQSPASVALHPRLTPNSPPPSPLPRRGALSSTCLRAAFPERPPPSSPAGAPLMTGPTCHQCGAQHHLELHSSNSASRGPPRPGQHAVPTAHLTRAPGTASRSSRGYFTSFRPGEQRRRLERITPLGNLPFPSNHSIKPLIKVSVP